MSDDVIFVSIHLFLSANNNTAQYSDMQLNQILHIITIQNLIKNSVVPIKLSVASNASLSGGKSSLNMIRFRMGVGMTNSKLKKRVDNHAF